MIPATQLFLNREIGWLKFNKRVLFQAKEFNARPIDPLGASRLVLLEHLKMLPAQPLGDQVSRGLADQFGTRIPEHGGTRWVGILNLA